MVKHMNQERGSSIQEESMTKSVKAVNESAVESRRGTSQQQGRKQFVISNKAPLQITIVSEKKEAEIARNPREKLTQNLNRLKQ